MTSKLLPLPHFIQRGTGDTVVVLLHGVGGGHRAFDATLPSLAKAGYRAIAWDAPGYGLTAPLDPLDMPRFAEALLRLIHHVRAGEGAHAPAQRVVVLGHSMGGMIAQEACFLEPTAFDGLVLFATSAAFGKPGGDWQKEFLQSRFAALDAGLGMVGLSRVLVGGMLALGTSEQIRAAAMKLMTSVPEATYRAALAAIVTFNRLENLAHIKVPTLCLACHDDKTAPPAVMEKMAEKIPNADYCCLANAGHLGNMEQPHAFNAAVLDYLRKYFPIKV
jgi:3-oxoadipate enol-lactonase